MTALEDYIMQVLGGAGQTQAEIARLAGTGPGGRGDTGAGGFASPLVQRLAQQYESMLPGNVGAPRAAFNAAVGGGYGLPIEAGVNVGHALTGAGMLAAALAGPGLPSANPMGAHVLAAATSQGANPYAALLAAHDAAERDFPVGVGGVDLLTNPLNLAGGLEAGLATKLPLAAEALHGWNALLGLPFKAGANALGALTRPVARAGAGAAGPLAGRLAAAGAGGLAGAGVGAALPGETWQDRVKHAAVGGLLGATSGLGTGGAAVAAPTAEATLGAKIDAEAAAMLARNPAVPAYDPTNELRLNAEAVAAARAPGVNPPLPLPPPPQSARARALDLTGGADLYRGYANPPPGAGVGVRARAPDQQAATIDRLLAYHPAAGGDPALWDRLVAEAGRRGIPGEAIDAAVARSAAPPAALDAVATPATRDAGLAALSGKDTNTLLGLAYDHPNAIRNAQTKYGEVTALRDRAIARIQADAPRVAALAQADPDLAARVAAMPDAAVAPAIERAAGTLPPEPPATNYTVPLSDLTDRLYHGTNIDGAMPLIDPQTSMGSVERYYSNTPDLALGQGANTGVLLEFSPEGLQGQINKKPAWEVAWRSGAAEFRDARSSSDQIRRNLLSVTVEPGLSAPAGYRQRFARVLGGLEAQGWTKEALPDGGVRYARPEAAPPAPAAIAPQEAAQAATAPLEQAAPAQLSLDALPPEQSVGYAQDRAAFMDNPQTARDRIAAIEASPEGQTFRYINSKGQFKSVDTRTGTPISVRGQGGKIRENLEAPWNTPGTHYDEVAQEALSARLGPDAVDRTNLDDFFQGARDLWQERNQLRAQLRGGGDLAAGGGGGGMMAVVPGLFQGAQAARAVADSGLPDVIAGLHRMAATSYREANAGTATGGANAAGKYVAMLDPAFMRAEKKIAPLTFGRNIIGAGGNVALAGAGVADFARYGVEMLQNVPDLAAALAAAGKDKAAQRGAYIAQLPADVLARAGGDPAKEAQLASMLGTEQFATQDLGAVMQPRAQRIAKGVQGGLVSPYTAIVGPVTALAGAARGEALPYMARFQAESLAPIEKAARLAIALPKFDATLAAGGTFEEAIAAGREASLAGMGRYGDENGLVRGLMTLFPGVNWNLQQARILARAASRNPVLAMGTLTQLHADAVRHGLDPQNAGKVQLGGFRADPLYPFSPVGAEAFTLGDRFAREPSANPLDKGLEGASALGAGLNPEVAAILYGIGASSSPPVSADRLLPAQQFADELWRTAGLPVAPNLIGQKLADLHQIARGGKVGDTEQAMALGRYTDYQAQRAGAERVLAETGHPITDPRNIDALREMNDPHSARYLQAVVAGLGPRALAAILGFFAPASVQYASPTETLVSSLGRDLPSADQLAGVAAGRPLDPSQTYGAGIGLPPGATGPAAAALLQTQMNAFTARHPELDTYAAADDTARRNILLLAWEREHSGLMPFPALFQAARAREQERLGITAPGTLAGQYEQYGQQQRQGLPLRYQPPPPTPGP